MYSKAEVKFEHPGMGHDKCAVCKHFVPDENRCNIVSGIILAQDWCTKFKQGEPVANKPMSEHDTIRSRTTGRNLEISMGPQSGGKVPANPFASLAQEGFLHAHPEKLGKAKLAEFDAATKGKHLPKRVK